MDGLILRLRSDSTGAPGRWFWKLFGPIRRDLDRMYWCFSNQPWMGAPEKFRDEDLEPFEESGASSIQLWRPGALSRYGDDFAEEFIELWAIEPTRDDPAQLAAEFSIRNWSEDVIRQHARFWLMYTDSTCWEIYARKPVLLDKVRENLQGKPWVEVFQSQSEHRASSFGMAGLSEVWKAMYGGRA